MTTASLISIDQYESTSYRPDCDYIDGEIRERNLGKFDHSNLQRVLVGILFAREQDWNVLGLPEQRLRVSATRIRIPDVCIVSSKHEVEQTLTRPPLVCIEILSPGDTLASTRPRLEDYRSFGVSENWVFHPADRQAWTYDGTDFHPADEILRVAGTEIMIVIVDLFAHVNSRSL